MYTRVSSAYILTFLFMDHRTVPYGTPDKTAVDSLIWWPTKTLYVLLERKSEIHSKTGPLIPYDANLWQSYLCGTLLKTLTKSRKMAWINSLLFKHWAISSIVAIIWLSQHHLSLNSCCSSQRMLAWFRCVKMFGCTTYSRILQHKQSNEMGL